jgi:hypothetical protein
MNLTERIENACTEVINLVRDKHDTSPIHCPNASKYIWEVALKYKIKPEYLKKIMLK